jgi:4-amino-4-deoxy-L-arabinose transferase-like glycosyltransferase
MRPTLFIGAGVVVVLVVFASGYGYHRDELYFLAAGHHLAWSYADQGPITPLIARGMSSLSAHSLTVLRLPSALAAGGTVLLTGALAREFGGERRAATIAAACAAVASLVLFTGHLLSTSTFDLLVWTGMSWLVVRAIRTGQDRLWLVAGVVLGVGLLNKPLPAFLAGGFLVGVLIAGPRRLLVNRFVCAGAAIALALWSPWLIWQAQHGWPQIDVSRSIANGGSASSQPWWAIVPFQLLLVSPVLAPVWVAGLVRLFRDPAVRDYRFIAWAWVALAIAFMASGGKPYYLGGLLPVLLGAGAAPVDRWLRLGRSRARERTLRAAIVLSGAVSAVIALPLLPARDAGPTVAVNADVGETIGWPDLVRTVARVDRHLPDPGRAVLFTRNYGEAGAIDRYGDALGLPRAYSGHNAFASWGPPPDGRAQVITVGLTWQDAKAHFRGCRPAARIENRAGIDNDERHALVLVCAGPRRPWSSEWRALRHLG